MVSGSVSLSWSRHQGRALGPRCGFQGVVRRERVRERGEKAVRKALPRWGSAAPDGRAQGPSAFLSFTRHSWMKFPAGDIPGAGTGGGETPAL